MRWTLVIMLSLLAAPAVVVAADTAPADAEEASAAREKPAAQADAADAADPEAVPVPVKAAKAAKAEEAFVPPDGWKPKKRGKFTVYCRRQGEMGTRLEREVCYDEAGIREMLAKQLEDQEKVDQMRRICASQAACGAN